MELKYLFTISTIGLLTFASCADEVTINNGASQEQLDASNKAKEALLYAIPAYSKNFQTVGTGAYDWGYGSIMHIRDVMTADLSVPPVGFDWYSTWAVTDGLGDGWLSTQFIWNYHYKYVLTTNNLIRTIDEEKDSEKLTQYLGVGLTFRAFLYLDMARMYEFLPNDKTSNINSDGNDVLNLTVPIVTEKDSEESARNNPRATRQTMYEFILSDLNRAETLLAKYNRPNKTFPDLGVVYGLKARLYMWVEDYPKAQEYARKSINQSGAIPVSASEWNNTSSGFNSLSTSAWMFGTQMTSEDEVVKTENSETSWTSWMSPEAQYGYAAVGALSMIGVELYNKISDEDFRKYSFIAPKGSPIANKVVLIDAEFNSASPTYTGIKFRPVAGNVKTSIIGSASAYPLMRVEEMYLIEAEAAAQTTPATGKNLLESFMKNYRYPNYIFAGTTKDEVVDEIFLQKRIEFWGEGITFFDYKRLNKPVIRRYADTNFAQDRTFNTTTRPAWMNFVIIRTEPNNNDGVLGFNNPDPSDKYESRETAKP